MRSIVVDFNTMQTDPRQRVVIGEVGTPNGDRLAGCQSGETILLDGGDLQVIGTLEYDSEQHVWYAVPDWSTSRDIPVGNSEDIAV